MEKGEKVDAEKLIHLLNMKNSIDFSGTIDISMQIAMQSKLIQVAKKKIGLYSGELGYFDASGSRFRIEMFTQCKIPRTVDSYEGSVDKLRLDYVQFWAAGDPEEIYDSGMFPEDMVTDVFFVFDTCLLQPDGTCGTCSPDLEEMVRDFIEEFQMYEDEEETESVRRIAYFIRQMDFYFSGRI